MPDDEDNDDEELEAYEDSIQRLRVCPYCSVTLENILICEFRYSGSGRCDKKNDERAICFLFRVPSSLFYIQKV
jgi:hypothetical protein